MGVFQISKIQFRRGSELDLPGKPTSLSPLVFEPGLDVAEVGFTVDTGRLFIGQSPAYGQPNYKRTAFPYQNLEILTEASTDALGRIFNFLQRDIGSGSFFKATLQPTGVDDWQDVRVERAYGTSSAYRVPGEEIIAMMEYYLIEDTQERTPLRTGQLRFMSEQCAEEVSLKDDALVSRRLDLPTPEALDPNAAYDNVSFRLIRGGAIGDRYFRFQYVNSVDVPVNLWFRIERPLNDTPTPFDTGVYTGTISNTPGFSREDIQDIVGDMVTLDKQVGIKVTYNDCAGKIDFENLGGGGGSGGTLRNFTLTLNGDAQGTVAIGGSESVFNMPFTLNSTGVNAGTYTNPTMTVDGKGRVLAITNGSSSSGGSSGGGTGSDPNAAYAGTNLGSGIQVYASKNDRFLQFRSIVAGSGINVIGSGTEITVSQAATSVTAGTYTNPTITVGSDGRISAVTSGTGGGSNSGISPNTPTSFRAWRIKINNTGLPSYCSVGDMVFATVKDVAELVSGGTAFSSPTGNNASPNQAFDDNPFSRWVASYPDNGYPKFLGYIYPSTKTVTQFLLTASNGFPVETPINFEVQGSNDTKTGLDGTWTTVTQIVTTADWSNGETRAFDVAPPKSATIPPGGSLGQVLTKVSDTDYDMVWTTPAASSGGGSTGGSTVSTGSSAFPRVAQFTDTSVFGRGSSNVKPTLTDTSNGLVMQDKSGDGPGYKTALRAIPTAPTASNPFEFVANIADLEGSAQYGIVGLAVADTTGNVQFWGVNGGNSGRSGNGCASYAVNGTWQDGDYTLGSAADGAWFRIVATDTTMNLYRSTDGQTWVLKDTLSGRGFGTITRYGFMVHRFSTGTGDTLTVASAYSTEFPKSAASNSSGSTAAPAGIAIPSKAYWRVYMPPGSGYFAYCINQLDFLDASGAVIPTTGATFTSRSADGTHVAASAFDNDDSTFYSCATFGSVETGTVAEWLAVQFPKAVSVAALRIKSRPGTSGETKQVPALFLLQHSSDGGAWRTLAEFGSTEFVSGVARVFPVND